MFESLSSQMRFWEWHMAKPLKAEPPADASERAKMPRHSCFLGLFGGP